MERTRPTAFGESASFSIPRNTAGATLRHYQPLTNWAEPAMLPPMPSPVWPSKPVETNMRPLALGYFRVSSGTPNEQVKRFRDDIAAYAEREGFTLPARFLVLDNSSRPPEEGARQIIEAIPPRLAPPRKGQR